MTLLLAKHTIDTSLPNTYLRQFFRYLGGAPGLLAGTEQTPQTLAQVDGRNSFKDYCRFYSNAQKELDEPAIGLVIGQVNQLANMHGPLSAAVYQSTDIRDCLDLLRRFIPLRCAAFKTRWYEDRENIGVEVLFQESAGDAHIPVSEALMAALTNLISVTSQQRVRPSRIELDYPRPAYADRYPDAYRAASFRFSCPSLKLLVTRADGQVRTDTEADPSLRAAAIERCEELLKGAPEVQSTADRLRQIFTDNPGHLWTLHDMAKHLNTSESTLQRRLAAEGISYRKLSDGWLQGEARKLLAERNLSVESIAVLLGYSDVSNFRHACRRWFGVSPRVYRDNKSKAS